MPDINLDHWNKKEFADNTLHVLQFPHSRLMGKGFVRKVTQNSKFKFWDYLGKTKPALKQGKNPITPNVAMEHSRRRLSLRDYNWGKLIDRTDIRNIGSDPQNPYVKAARMGWEELFDEVTMEAIFANAWAGEEGNTAVPFPDEQRIGAVNTNDGATVARLRSVLELFEKNGKGPNDKVYAIIPPEVKTQLLLTTQIGSIEYNNAKALYEGRVNEFMGIEFIEYPGVPMNSDGRYRVPFLLDDAITMARDPDNVVVKLSEREDLSHTPQLYMEMGMGATRNEEKRVEELVVKI